jgi:hypothetical protein
MKVDETLKPLWFAAMPVDIHERNRVWSNYEYCCSKPEYYHRVEGYERLMRAKIAEKILEGK